MKFLSALLVVAGASAMPMRNLLQTPDRHTPANEDVCYVTQAPGVTKGLYGRCVAFCEARDIADFSDPITQAELDDLEASVPQGRILEKYNEKKSATDPAMPCINVAANECPCWTEVQIAAFPSPTRCGNTYMQSGRANIASVFTNSCNFQLTTGVSQFVPGLSEEQISTCLASIAAASGACP